LILTSIDRRSRSSLSNGAVFAFYTGFAALGVMISWVHRGSLPFVLPGGGNTNLLVSLGLGLGVGLAIAGLSFALQRKVRAFSDLEDALAEQIGRPTKEQAVLYALLSGFAEEILFRGALLPWVGALASSLLFGALHIGPDRRLLLWIPVAFTIGLVFASLSLYTGDVAAAAVAHSLVNFIGFVELARR
jgi:hypothetical protein